MEAELDNDRDADILRTIPRPTASGGFWDESLGLPAGMNPHPPGLAAMLGLPTGDGCEFGPCGVGGSTFAEGQSSFPNVTIAIPSDPDFTDWFNKQQTKVHGVWTYGNWCGKGGSGAPVDDIDAACMLHDYCYDRAGVSILSDIFPASSETNAAIQSCNQQLCNALNTTDSSAATKIIGFFSLATFKPSTQCQ